MSNPNSNPHIISNNSIFLFCKAPDGEAITIADVREWLTKVDELRLPEDTELEGALFLNVDQEDATFSRILCGECIPSCEHRDFLIELPHTNI